MACCKREHATSGGDGVLRAPWAQCAPARSRQPTQLRDELPQAAADKRWRQSSALLPCTPGWANCC
eukprot:4103797-Pleurochrysis_carterae.AAC.1